MYIPNLLKIGPVVSDEKMITDDHSQLIAKELNRLTTSMQLVIVIPQIKFIKHFTQIKLEKFNLNISQNILAGIMLSNYISVVFVL